MMAILASAMQAHAAGLCVVPPREDGTKAPLGEWKRFQHERPTSAQVEAWYGGGQRHGLGLVCGAVSGGLELFEFDDAGTFFELRARAAEAGLSPLLDRLAAGYLEQTPKRGYHILYRCSEITGNTKLARRLKRPEEMLHPADKVQVLVETRGEGGYVIVAPSHGRVHPSGKPYVLLAGGAGSIATITPEERADLWALARTFDRMPAPVWEQHTPTPALVDGDRPGDAFNRSARWSDILEPAGWRFVFQRGDVGYWRRPGKSTGISASVNYGGSELLYVFTSSSTLEPERGYSKFSAFALLHHGGDFHAAARALIRESCEDRHPQGEVVVAYGEVVA